MSERERTLLLISIALAGFLGAFAVSATNIALPAIQAEFEISAAVLSWIPMAYVLATASALMPMGRIADVRGHKRSFIWSIRLFTVILLGTAFAPSAGVLVGLRAALGLSSAMAIPTSTAIVTFAYAPEERGRALGFFAAGPYLGMTLGPVLGGIITFQTGWRTLFLMAGGLSVVNCVIPVWRTGGVEWFGPRVARFDKLGSALYAVALPMLLLGFTMLPRTYGPILVAMGIGGLAIFVYWETRAANPLLNVDLFRHNRMFAFSNMAAFINYAATLAVTFLMSLYLQYTRGLNPQTAGFVLMTGALVQAAFSPVAGRVSDQVEPRWVASGGMVLCALGLLGLVFVDELTAYWYIVVMLCLLGLGFAFFAAPITHAVMSSVDRQLVGTASSTLAAVRWTGQNLSIGLAGLVLASVIGEGAVEPADYPAVLAAVRITLAIFTVLCSLGVAASLVGSKRVSRRPS